MRSSLLSGKVQVFAPKNTYLKVIHIFKQTCGVNINLEKYISPDRCVKKCTYLHLKIICIIARSFFLPVTFHENSQTSYKQFPPTFNFVNFVHEIFILKEIGLTSNGCINHHGKYLYVQFINLIKIIYDDIVGNILQQKLGCSLLTQ